MSAFGGKADIDQPLAPPAFNAADQPFAAVVDLDQRVMEWGQCCIDSPEPQN